MTKHPQEKTYFHGTFWSTPDSVNDLESAAFFELDSGYSDFNVVYITNSEDVARHFSKSRSSWMDTPVILKGKLHTTNILERSAKSLMMNRAIQIDGETYDISDRETLFEGLRAKYDGLNITDNYDNNGDDIALFNAHDFNAEYAKLFIDGEWTDWLDHDEAVKTFGNYLGLRTHAP